MAAYRNVYTPPETSFPLDDKPDVDSDVELFGEEAVKEKRVIESNRAKLTQYIHDCTVLFPFMKQEMVFTNDDCDLVRNEVTGTLRVDKFIDIVLSKGPRGVGKFHEALAKDYPAVFDVLCRLFSNGGISLPLSRQLKETDEFDYDEQNMKLASDHTNPRSRASMLIARHGMRTIKKHFKELDKQCEEARSQKDELQRVLIQREMEINTLLRNRDIWMQQNLVTVNEKYQDLLVQLVNWREQVVTQSDGNIALLVRERETIQDEYEQLEAEYMLTVSELSAAKDRISKLLTHLEQTDKEVTIAEERQLDKIAQLEDKIAQLEGENQRQQRRVDRLSKEPGAQINGCVCDGVENESGTNKQLLEVVEERDSFKNRMEAALRERKGTLDELDHYVDKLHSEREKRKRIERELKMVRSQVPVSTMDSDVTNKQSTNGPTPLWSSSFPGYPVSVPSVGDRVPEECPGKMQDVTIVLPAQGSEMKIGVGVVVRELDTNGKAWKSGVRVGDEIQQINHINITTDNDPLSFARKLLGSADGTVTLYIKRQQAQCTNSLVRSSPYTPHASTPVSPYSATLVLNPLELDIIRRRRSEGYSPTMPVRQPHNMMMSSNCKNPSTTTSTSAQDSSVGDSEESDSYPSDCYSVEHKSGFLATKQHSKDSDASVQRGVFGSPRNSNPKPNTLSGHSFALNEVSISPQRILGGSDSDSPQQSPQEVPKRSLTRERAIRPKRPRKSIGLPNDNDEVESSLEVNQQVQKSNTSDNKRVVLPHSQLGDGLTLIGGRGYGIFIVSDGQRKRSDFQTGDEVLQIGPKSVQGLTYNQVMDVLESLSLRGNDCMMTLRSNIEGFSKLPSNSARDNFYVRAKLSHQKSSKLGDLGYQKGDIFRVIDTKPEGQSCAWGAEKINSKGDLIESGFLPLLLDPQELAETPGGTGVMTLPNMTVINTHKGTVASLYTLPANARGSSTDDAFQIYEPIKKVEAIDPRPVVLVGSHEPQIRRQLVEHGSDAEIKFAYCRRAPAKNLEGVSPDMIVESMETEDGVFQSTVDYVTDIAKKGYHCVLCLNPSDLPSPGVTALTPIVLLLNPKRGFKIKHQLKSVQSGNLTNKPSLTVEQIKEIGRKYKIYITGQIELSSTMHINDIIQAVRSTVARQQKSVIWELDH